MAELEDATQLASEVMANVVLHAGTPYEVDVRVDAERRELVVSVTDLSPRQVLPPIAQFGLQCLLAEPDLDAESGRGLTMVATLADRWGIEPAPPGKTVWFALALSREK